MSPRGATGTGALCGRGRHRAAEARCLARRRLSLDGGRAARRARRARLRGAPSRGVLILARSGLPPLGGTRTGASRSLLETSARTCVRGARALAGGARGPRRNYGCLLYTSDAADDLLCVDLGGRRIIQ